MAIDWVIAVPLGFALGFVIGLTGVGGGALVAPALYIVLGLAYADSVALSLVYSVFTKIFSAVQHLRQGTVLWRITLLYGLTGIPGAVAGSRIIYGASEDVQKLFPFLMSGVLLVVAALLLIETGMTAVATRPKPFSPDHVTLGGAAVIAGFQSLVGALMGLTSIGSGSLVILSMVYLFRMRASEIVGTNIVIALIMVIPAGLTHYLVGRVNLRLLALLLLGSFLGAIFGSKATLHMTDHALKLLIAALIVGGAISTVVKAW